MIAAEINAELSSLKAKAGGAGGELSAAVAANNREALQAAYAALHAAPAPAPSPAAYPDYADGWDQYDDYGEGYASKGLGKNQKRGGGGGENASNPHHHSGSTANFTLNGHLFY